MAPLRRLIAFLLLALVAAPLASIAAEPAPQVLQSAASIERDRFLEIQSLYGRSSYSRVIALAQAFELEFATSARIPEVLNLKGLALLLSRDAPAAANAFEAALLRAPDALLGDRNWKNYVRYNHAAALLESGKAAGATTVLSAIDPESLDGPTRLKYFLLKSRSLEKQENYREALLTWVSLDRRREELHLSSETILSNVDRLLSRVPSRSALVEVERQSEGTSLGDRVAFRSVQFLVNEGRSIEARDGLRAFLKNHPNSPRAADASSLLRGMRQSMVTGGLSIGVLMPQQGRFTRISQRILQAITLALGIYGPHADQRIQLIIEDSGEDLETALQALERLHSQHKVAAVIGPILSKGADAIIQRAEELGLPIVSLAQQAGHLGEFSTQAAITPAMQTRELARHAIQKMGLRRFAIIAPKDRFGEEYGQSFWNAVEEFGGTVTAHETYEPGETDFRKSIDRLAGLFYADSRRREVFALAQERERDQIRKRTRKTEKYFSLTPIVDFDAVFIPDEPKAASLVLPTFAYRDIDQIKVLGISAWNSPEFLQRAQKTADGVVFLDAFFPLANSPQVRDFSEKFRGTFGQEAASMEATAFDAAAILAKVVASEANVGEVDRMQVANRVRQLRDVSGVTGKITVIDGSWARDLRVLTIKDSEVLEWKNLPPSKPATSAD